MNPFLFRLREALDITEKGGRDEDTAYILDSLADVHVRQDRYHHAMTTYEMALKKKRERYGSDHYEVRMD